MIRFDVSNAVRGMTAGALGLGLCLAPASSRAQQVVDLPGQDRSLPAGFEEIFRVGSMDGAEWETFGDIRGVAFDARGNLYVFDPQSSRVVVTDASGRFVREVGQAGDGPGELRTPVAFTVLRDGSIVIADMGHRAYQLFGPDGAFQRMVTFPGAEEGVIRLGGMAPDPRGGAIFSGGGNTMTVAMSREGPGGAPPAPTGRPIEHVSLAGGAATGRTVVDAWAPPRSAAPPRPLEGGGMRFAVNMAGPRTFEPGLFVGPLPDGGLAYSDTTGYAVKVTDAAGRLQRVLRRPFNPRTVTPAIQEAEKKRRLDELEAGGGPRMRIVAQGPGGQNLSPSPEAIREMMRGQVEAMEFYPELPVLMNLVTGWGGKIWAVRRGDPPVEAGPIDILTPAGEYVGTFSRGATPLPSAFGPDGMVAFIERDEFDVPTVVVKRLPAALR